MSIPSFDENTDLIIKSRDPPVSTHARQGTPKMYICEVCKGKTDETGEPLRYEFDKKSSHTNHMYTHQPKQAYKDDIIRVCIPWDTSPIYDHKKGIFVYSSGFNLPKGYKLLELNSRNVRVLDNGENVHKQYAEAVLIKEGLSI